MRAISNYKCVCGELSVSSSATQSIHKIVKPYIQGVYKDLKTFANNNREVFVVVDGLAIFDNRLSKILRQFVHKNLYYKYREFSRELPTAKSQQTTQVDVWVELCNVTGNCNSPFYLAGYFNDPITNEYIFGVLAWFNSENQANEFKTKISTDGRFSNVSVGETKNL